MELIERAAVVALIEAKQKELCPVGIFSRHAVYGTDRDRFDAWDEIIDQIDALPTVDALPVVHGRWIFRSITGEDPYECSACGNTVNVHGYPNCPYCTARMDGGDGHEAD